MSERAPSIPRRDAYVLAAVLAVALLLRVAYVLGQRGDVLFDFPVVDEERYVAMARAFARGEVADPRPWFHPPGLVYALSVVFRVAGPGLLVPRLVQAALSTATCALAYQVATKFFSRGVALGAAALCAVHGVLVFESYELLPPTWMAAADLAALLLVARAKEGRGPAAALAAGLALGVAALFGPTILPFVPFAAGWLRRPASILALLAGVAVPIAPVTWGNWQRGHEVVLVSTNGGINFLLGNEPDYPSLLSIRPGPHWDDLRDMPRRAGVTTEGGASSFYFDRGVGFWREHPWRCVGLTLRKAFLFFDGPEIPRDTDVQAMRNRSRLLSVLVSRGPPWLPDGLLVPLAIVGAFASWRDRRPQLLVAFVVIQALVIAAFFVTSRYRVPALPVIAMLASEGMDRCVGALRSTTSPARLLPAAACLALTVPLNVVTRESSGSYAAELEFYRGLETRTYVADLDGAVAYFMRAAHDDPGDARPAFELGNTLASLRRDDEAVAAWLQAEDRDPWDGRAVRRAVATMIARGEVEGARARMEHHLAHPLRDASYYAPDHLTLAALAAKSPGRTAQDLEELAAAERADPPWFRANIARFTRWFVSTPARFVDPAFLAALAEADLAASEPTAADAARRFAPSVDDRVVPSVE